MSPADVIALRRTLGIKAVPVHSGAMNESRHQMALFRWASLAENTIPELRWLHSIPAGGFRTKATAGKMKGEGLKAGIPDIFLDVPRKCYHGLRIELKVPRVAGVRGAFHAVQPGKTSDLQEEWLKHYHAEGYAAHVAYGWEDAKAIILEYLNE